jgi:hypothetical protein
MSFACWLSQTKRSVYKLKPTLKQFTQFRVCTKNYPEVSVLKERKSAANLRRETRIFLDIFDLSVFICVYPRLNYSFPNFLLRCYFKLQFRVLFVKFNQIFHIMRKRRTRNAVKFQQIFADFRVEILRMMKIRNARMRQTAD